MKKIRKDMEYLKDMTENINKIDTSRTLHPTNEEQCIYSFQAYMRHLQKMTTYRATKQISTMSKSIIKQTTLLIHNAIN